MGANDHVQIANSEILVEQIINLRYKVLREPWGKSIETATDEKESESINAFVEDKGTIVACGRIQKNNDTIAQVRYMAVNAKYQGQGLGKRVLKKLEEKAIEYKVKKIQLQARENAVNFYKAQGYVIKEKSFVLWDIIQHYLMEKDL